MQGPNLEGYSLLVEVYLILKKFEDGNSRRGFKHGADDADVYEHDGG